MDKLEKLEMEKQALLKKIDEMGVEPESLGLQVVDRKYKRYVDTEVIKKKPFLSDKTKETLTVASLAAAAAVGGVLGSDEDLDDSPVMQVFNSFTTSYNNAKMIRKRIHQSNGEERLPTKRRKRK